MSRVPVYCTSTPVAASNGATIARNDSCSEPPHVPITLTVPPICPESVALGAGAELAGADDAAADAGGAELAAPLPQAAATIATIARVPMASRHRDVGRSIDVSPFPRRDPGDPGRSRANVYARLLLAVVIRYSAAGPSRRER